MKKIKSVFVALFICATYLCVGNPTHAGPAAEYNGHELSCAVPSAQINVKAIVVADYSCFTVCQATMLMCMDKPPRISLHVNKNAASIQYRNDYKAIKRHQPPIEQPRYLIAYSKRK